MTKRYTLEELLAVEVSKRVVDDEMNFTGIGTGGKAYIRACGIPLVAVRLAQFKHAPNALCMMGPVLDPVLDHDTIPSSNWEYDLIHWPCRSQIPLEDCLGLFRLGLVGLAFASGAQVDKFGNLNIACIGDYRNPKIRLPGVLAQTELASHAKRVGVIVNHDKRILVDRCDFISGASGHTDRSGLPGGGVAFVMTNLCVMGVNPETKTLRVESIHPGATARQIRENTGYAVEIPPDVPATPEPDEADLRLIREQIDPRKLFLNAGITQDWATLED